MKITRTDKQKRPYDIQLDRCDLALYRRHKWQRHTKGMIRYEGGRKGQGSVLLHREIMGVGPELYVLHRNGDKFDCRRENLEVITFQEQRDRKRVPRKPYFNRRSRTGALVGVTIQKHVHRWTNGNTSTYHCANSCFSHQRQVFTKRFSVEGARGARGQAPGAGMARRQDSGVRHGAEPRTTRSTRRSNRRGSGQPIHAPGQAAETAQAHESAEAAEVDPAEDPEGSETSPAG